MSDRCQVCMEVGPCDRKYYVHKGCPAPRLRGADGHWFGRDRCPYCKQDGVGDVTEDAASCRSKVHQ